MEYAQANRNNRPLIESLIDKAALCQGLSHRLQCLDWLKEIGYQVGTGIMVGSPYQTVDHLVEDIIFIERFQPEMIGLSLIHISRWAS